MSDDGPYERLDHLVAGWRAVFVVVDGATFDDFPAELRCRRLFGRSLFLDTADPDVQKAGPWLLALERGQRDEVFSLISYKENAVLWTCEQGQQVLFRHLRTLNVAKIPMWAANGFSGPRSDLEFNDCSSLVFLRHWDPSVLATLMPVLDANQFARFLGPASELAFVDFATGLRHAKRPVDTLARPGTLSIRSDQALALNDLRLAASQQRIAMYLREVAPDQTSSMTQVELKNYVEEAESSGRLLGIKDEQALGLWCYLMIITKGEVAREKQVRLFIRQGASPDRQVFALMNDTINEVRRHESAMP